MIPRNGRMSIEPQRLPNGQWRCEVGAGVSEAAWCKRPATQVIEGLSARCPGAIVCDECLAEAKAKSPRPMGRVRYVPLDNPAPASSRSEGEP